MITSINEIQLESETAQELRPEYVEVLKALIITSQQGMFPMKGSGSITLHYNEKGVLVKVVPSLYIKLA